MINRVQREAGHVDDHLNKRGIVSQQILRPNSSHLQPKKRDNNNINNNNINNHINNIIINIIINTIINNNTQPRPQTPSSPPSAGHQKTKGSSGCNPLLKSRHLSSSPA